MALGMGYACDKKPFREGASEVLRLTILLIKLMFIELIRNDYGRD